jgi:hypothetical protein
MDSISPGQLVQVVDGGPALDGIVFEIASATKVIVAVVDPRRGPSFRTVHPKALSERLTEGTEDPALRRLVRRTRPPGQRGERSGPGTGRGHAGHTRPATHRAPGK